MLRGELPPEMVKSQQTMLLDQFVEEKLLKQRAERFGYRITDAELARQLMQRPEFQVDGKFSQGPLQRAAGREWADRDRLRSADAGRTAD